MNKLNLQSITHKRKRKYSSYQGTIGKIADNHIKRNDMIPIKDTYILSTN